MTEQLRLELACSSLAEPSSESERRSMSVPVGFIAILTKLLSSEPLTFTTGPILVNELAHPRQRGTVASTFNVLWYLGSIIASWTIL